MVISTSIKTDNRVFWKISDKVKIRSKITLFEDNKILSQDAEIAKLFNEYFINIPILNIPNNQSFSAQTCSLEENTTSGIIERYNDWCPESFSLVNPPPSEFPSSHQGLG